MERSYDEDITDNRFFTTLQTKHKQLYQKATQQRCMICVPRTGVFTRISLSVTDFENHILVTEDEQLNVFQTFNQKKAKVTGVCIITGEGFKEERTANILFDETFYNEHEESFRVLCIDRLLEGGTNTIEDPVMTCLETYEDCCEFLWGNKHSKASHKKVDDLIEQFLLSSQRADTLRHIIDTTSTVFTRCIQIALRDVVLRTMQKNPAHMDNLKIAMETYIMNAIYNKVFKAVSQFFAVEDANLNKITRNLSELQVRDVGVRSEFTTNVPRARREMSTLNKFSTPLGKMQCLRRTVMAITQQGFRGKLNDNARAMSSDDLLPLLVFLVVKAEIPNWLANLSYMQNFCLSNFAGGEFGFYMASIEAAVEHVKSGAVSKSTAMSPIASDRPRFVLPPSSPSKTGSESLWQRLDSGEHEYTPAVDVLFKHVIEGRVEEVESMLEASSTDYSWLINQMCHPLCSCDKCEQILASKRNDPRAVTASSRDNRGCTPMHAAAAYGHPEMISVLMRRGGEVNATDYHGSTPLHLACQRGHQDVTLLLLSKGSLVGVEDNDGNRPLHMCCANGHEECVKALLYSTKPTQKVLVNAINTRGDTALHLASRWGYASIVSLLIDHGASVEARNRRQETPLMCSHNINISRTILVNSPIDEEDSNTSPYATSPPIASILSAAEDESHVTPITVPVIKLTRVLQPGQKEVEKLLRSVADGDILMMKHHLGWLSDSDFEDDDDDDGTALPPDSKLCHPLCQCSKCAMLQKRTTISSTGLSVNSSNADGYTPLHVAALHGHEALVDLLLRRGAGVNHRNNSSQQCTPLHLACQCNHPKVVSRLLNHGGKCNTRDARGNSALHYCCLNGHIEPAEILLQHGAHVNQTNERGNTPLHEAARFNFTQLVRLLLDTGQANPHCRNKAQQTPLRLTQKRSDIARLLKAAMRRDDDLESVTSTETNTSSSSSQTDPMEAIVEADPSPSNKNNSVPTPPMAGSTPRQLGVHELFNYFGDMDRSMMRALNQAIKEFEPARQLRHVGNEAQHQESWSLYLKQQLEIQHFDRRKLRRAHTEDKSGPFFALVGNEFKNNSHARPPGGAQMDLGAGGHGENEGGAMDLGASLPVQSEMSELQTMPENKASANIPDEAELKEDGCRNPERQRDSLDHPGDGLELGDGERTESASGVEGGTGGRGAELNNEGRIDEDGMSCEIHVGGDSHVSEVSRTAGVRDGASPGDPSPAISLDSREQTCDSSPSAAIDEATHSPSHSSEHGTNIALSLESNPSCERSCDVSETHQSQPGSSEPDSKAANSSSESQSMMCQSSRGSSECETTAAGSHGDSVQSSDSSVASDVQEAQSNQGALKHADSGLKDGHVVNGLCQDEE